LTSLGLRVGLVGLVGTGAPVKVPYATLIVPHPGFSFHEKN
jgi:hypothetical protein